MIVFLVLTQLAINSPTTAAVRIESSYRSQIHSVNIERMADAFPVESSIDKESHQKSLGDETADSLNSMSPETLDQLPTAQAAIPSDNAPVLLPLTKGAKSIIISSQPSVPTTVIALGNTIDERADTKGERLKSNTNDHQHHSTLVF